MPFRTPSTLPLTLIAAISLALPTHLNGGETDSHPFSMVRIYIPEGDKGAEEEARKMGISIVDRTPDYIDAYILREEAAGIPFPHDILFESTLEMGGDPKILMRSEEFLREVNHTLKGIAEDYPEVSLLLYLGLSVEGRDILGLKVSDNPEKEEEEPEIRLLGGHHGDEVPSVMVPLHMASLLTSGYGEESEITEIVENREIWIVPVVNPDGLVHFSRYNANTVDLNRNYSYQWDPAEFLPGPYPFSEPETRAVRNLSLFNPFVLSLSYHSGSTLINYVWNFTYDPTPDEPLLIELSEGYAVLCLTPDFYVTNGADWYMTNGDTNDWSYGTFGDMDWTVEVSPYNGFPPADEEPGIEHEDSTIFIMNMAGRSGISGYVKDAESGAPLHARVLVASEGWEGWPVYTDPWRGDFYRPLLEGIYSVTVSSPGYDEEVVEGVTVEEGEPAGLLFELKREPPLDDSIRVFPASHSTRESDLKVTLKGDDLSWIESAELFNIFGLSITAAGMEDTAEGERVVSFPLNLPDPGFYHITITGRGFIQTLRNPLFLLDPEDTSTAILSIDPFRIFMGEDGYGEGTVVTLEGEGFMEGAWVALFMQDEGLILADDLNILSEEVMEITLPRSDMAAGSWNLLLWNRGGFTLYEDGLTVIDTRVPPQGLEDEEPEEYIFSCSCLQG